MAVISGTVGLYNNELLMVDDKPNLVISSNEPQSLVNIILNNGITLTCTAEQPIYTTDGIVTASELNLRHQLIFVSQEDIELNQSIIDDNMAEFLGIYFLTKSNGAPLLKLVKYMQDIKRLLSALESRIPTLKLSECENTSDKLNALFLTNNVGSYSAPYSVNKFNLTSINVFADTLIKIYGDNVFIKKTPIRHFLCLYLLLFTDKNAIINGDNIIINNVNNASIKKITYSETKEKLFIPIHEQGYLYCNGIKLECPVNKKID